jgi:carbamoyl-phosphate synthase large subunit
VRVLERVDAELMRDAKRQGYSDAQLAAMFNTTELKVRAHRKSLGITPVYKLVDTCAAEFEARTPYYYSTYEDETEVHPSDRPKIMVIGGGPNRIGQGIEFDYCCVHASMALREMGYESIMVNSNPETVSTDFDISDDLFFEPLTFEDVMNIYEVMKPQGVIVQFGGQTPINLARKLHDAGVPIIGTSVESIDAASDREQFHALVKKLGLRQPKGAITTDIDGAVAHARDIGFPVLVRPSFVLGGPPPPPPEHSVLTFTSDGRLLWFSLSSSMRTAKWYQVHDWRPPTLSENAAPWPATDGASCCSSKVAEYQA